ncbi:hypothetical protein IAR50_005700 [Cryptococcus sp. DSM 104548]
MAYAHTTHQIPPTSPPSPAPPPTLGAILHTFITSQKTTTPSTIYAIVLYCRSVELDAMEREWCRDVEKREVAKEKKVLF